MKAFLVTLMLLCGLGSYHDNIAREIEWCGYRIDVDANGFTDKVRYCDTYAIYP